MSLMMCNFKIRNFINISNFSKHFQVSFVKNCILIKNIYFKSSNVMFFYQSDLTRYEINSTCEIHKFKLM
jgi:hypothetical protein